MKRNKLICGIAALMLALCMPYAGADADTIEMPTQDEIAAFFAAHPWSTSKLMTYAVEPSYSEGCASRIQISNPFR